MVLSLGSRCSGVIAYMKAMKAGEASLLFLISSFSASPTTRTHTPPPTPPSPPSPSPPPISWFCSEAQESHSSFFFQHKERSHLPLTPKSLPTRKGHASASQKGSQRGRQSSPAPAKSSSTKGHILSWDQWVPAPERVKAKTQ